MLSGRPLRVEPATRSLIAINVGIFLAQLFAGPWWGWVVHFFALTAEGLHAGALWQLVTYQFLHGNELHIFVNMLGLWFAGRELERVLGTTRFLTVYFLGGIVGGLCQVGFVATSAPLIGASGSVCAVMLALTTLFPRMPITALVFFVLPLRMKARTLGAGLVIVSVLFWLSGFQPEVGHLAHLGGFATGWVFGRLFRARFGEEGRDYGTPPPLPDEWPASTAGRVGEEPAASSVDGVLAKVLAHGIESLTREERRILEEARRPRRSGGR